MIQDPGAMEQPAREFGHSAIVSVEFEVFGQVQGECCELCPSGDFLSKRYRSHVEALSKEGRDRFDIVLTSFLWKFVTVSCGCGLLVSDH